MSPCLCGHAVESHAGYRPGVVGKIGCLVEGCKCLKFRKAHVKDRAIITPEEKAFAERQIKQHQRMIFELRQMYGLSE